MYYVSFSTAFPVTCSGPGGYASSLAWVFVTRPLSGLSGAVVPVSLAASKDGKAAARRLPPALAHLGIDLTKLRYDYAEADLNNDGAPDLIVFDKTMSRVHILLNKNGSYPAIAKTVGNIGKLAQVKGVLVPSSGAVDEIQVTVEKQQ
jgi:hypothetical protein